MEVLEARLRARGTETEETLKQRLETARKELEYGTFASCDKFYLRGSGTCYKSAKKLIIMNF